VAIVTRSIISSAEASVGRSSDTRPVAGEVAVLVWELAGGRQAPAAARAAVRGALDGLVDDQALDLVLLLASEIVTNAVVHEGPGVVLTIEVADARVVVTVADSRPDAPALSSLARALVDGEGLVWGAHVHRSGKAVWFELPARRAGEVTGDGAGAGTVLS
jgi:hypothetical protein